MNKSFMQVISIVATLSLSVAHANEVSTKGGLKIKSEDGQFVGEFGGRMHADIYSFGDDGSVMNESGTDLRRLRLEGKGTMYGVYEAKIQLDFGTGRSSGTSSSTSVKDAYLAYSGFGPGKIYFGQVKTPMGLEELTSSNSTTLMERAAVISAVAPAHRRGVAYHGSTASLSYATMIYGQGTSGTGSGMGTNEGIGIGGRLAWVPIMDETRVVHLGVSAANEFNAHKFGDVSTRYEQNLADSVRILRFPTAVTDSDDVTRYGLEAAFAAGRLSAQAEYLSAQADSVTGGDPQVTGYYGLVSYFLTDDTRPYKASAGTFDRVKPTVDGGAWELAFRVSEVKGESDLATVQQGETKNISAGLNWYANPQVRFMLNLMKGDVAAFDNVGAPVAGEPEAIAVRAQFDF